MNESVLLEWILEDAEKNGESYKINSNLQDDLDAILLEDLRTLAGGGVELPDSLPSTSTEAIPLLRKHFKDDVTLISRILNHLFPKQYLFYRVSMLEDEIFRGFDFFSSLVPDLAFSFSRVGRNGFDRYLKINTTLLRFFNEVYPELGEDTQARIAWFLYEGLGRLFTEKSDYNRYWVMATRPEHFQSLDSDDELEWSGRKEMQEGDLVFMYRAAPRSAITDVLEVVAEPFFDPWAGWGGFRVNLRRVCRIEDVPFSSLRDDPVLGSWGVVRKRFNGVRTEPVPHTIYNRLLQEIPERLRDDHGLKPERTANIGLSGTFPSETAFEDQVIEPLLRKWGFGYQRQYRRRFRFGSQDHLGIVDFFLIDGKGPITLFESKFRILDERDLRDAREQGRSYALMLGVTSFVVASPEGIWIYSLNRYEEDLEMHVSLDELEARNEEIRSKLLRLRS
jgi:hypothetical protein